MTFLVALFATVVMAQELSLSDAVALAQKQHAAIAAARLRTQAAAHRVTQARAGYLPQVDYSESYQRSNNPVFVFGTLLTQRRFAESNWRPRRRCEPCPPLPPSRRPLTPPARLPASDWCGLRRRQSSTC